MPKTPLSADQLAGNFADLNPPLTRDEAVAEAARCLFCFDAPCTRACPTHIDVPKFIRQILHDNPAGAAETIFTQNIFGGSCARACPTEVLCEGACVDRALVNRPVQIGRLQRYATDHAMKRGLRFFQPGPDSGRRVAVVGAGPAGLSCAHELRRLGHAVTVFEARNAPGGLNTLGVAAYKITTEFSLDEIQAILEMGIDLRLNSPVSPEQLARLRREFDAVFLGIGLGETQRLNIPGEDGPGVWEGLAFVFQTHTRPLGECEVGRRVVVIGGGNTAIDCAVQAARLGAQKVIVAYRRTQEDMPAYKFEYELALADGVEFEWLAAPIEFVHQDGALRAVKMQRLRQEGRGRRAPLTPVPGGEFLIECDMAVKALGQTPLADWLVRVEGVRLENGRVVVDPATGAVAGGAPGLFAGGDCINGGAEIVNAVQDGKTAARGIHEYLSSGVGRK
ncbi:MAG: NAD(P)-dependent oxidoreductase [Candidatus Sumerlaeia bacterium]